MNNLAVFAGEYDGTSIRVTGDQFSVYDVLVAFVEPTERKGVKGTAINPRQIYKSITERYPELVQKMDSFKFPGRGQQVTPVTSEEGIYNILMLCPGKRGAEFRSWAAKIVRERREEETNPELAYDRGRARAAKVWKRNGLTDIDIAARIKGIEQRHYFTDTLQLHGVTGPGYAICTNALYLELFDCKAADLREQRGLSKRGNVRDTFDAVESAAVGLAEALSSRKVKDQNAQGTSDCSRIIQETSRKVRKAIE